MPRETYSVTFTDGHRQSFDGPPGMSDADVVQRARQERGFAGGEIATTKAGGFTRHVLEDEPQTVNALLGGAATFGGPAAVGAVPFVTSGLKRLSQLLATGHADAIGGAELAQDAVEGAVGAFGGPALKYGAQKVGATRAAVEGAVDQLPAWLGGLVRGGSKLALKPMLIDAATSKPALRAVEEVGEALTPRVGLGRLRGAARALTPGVEPPAPSPGFLQSVATKQRRGSMSALARQAQPRGQSEAVPSWLDDLLTERSGAAPEIDEAFAVSPRSPAIRPGPRPSTPDAAPAWVDDLVHETPTGPPIDESFAVAPRPPAPAFPRPGRAPATDEVPGWLDEWLQMRANSGTTGTSAVESAAESVPSVGRSPAAAPRPTAPPAATEAVAPRGGTQDQFAEWTLEARQARAAARASAPPPRAPDLTDEQAALLEQLLQTNSFRPFARFVGGP